MTNQLATFTDWTERVCKLAEDAKWAEGSKVICQGAAHDTGLVPPHVMPRLTSLARRLGYPVQYEDLPDEPVFLLGITHSSDGCNCGSHSGGKGIGLRPGMSPASTARVLGHELGHAMVNVTATADEKMLSKVLARHYGGENIEEEVACELGTAAFCERAGIGTREFLHQYMGNRLVPGQEVPENVISKAAVFAELLWEAVQS